ncbi:flippase-like domain-containing protein, partial [candidate division KSB1 bacterium]|nr:flippase-like domain-containing protein [candidate division KSB1 bacterium]
MQEKSGFAKNKWKIINLFFISLLLVGFILAFYNNWDELVKYKEVILNISLTNIFIILILTMSATIFRSWRWYFLLLPIKSPLPWKNILRITINALAANYSTPGKMGIPAKAVLLKQSEDIDVGKSLPSILGELFIEHSSEVSLALVCILIGGHFKKLFHAVENIINNSSVVQNILLFAGMIILLILAGIIFKKKLKTLN